MLFTEIITVYPELIQNQQIHSVEKVEEGGTYSYQQDLKVKASDCSYQS